MAEFDCAEIGKADELGALATRVAELERQVAELAGSRRQPAQSWQPPPLVKAILPTVARRILADTPPPPRRECRRLGRPSRSKADLVRRSST